MESYEAIRRAFDRVSPKQVAAELGMSLSMIYKWAQPNNETGSGSRNPLDRVLKLYELSGESSLIQWLCQRSGGYFVRNPPSRCEKGFEVLPATHEIVQQFAELLSTISQAAADNSITERESAKIREVWEKLKRYTEGFVRCCEEGDFEDLREQLRHHADVGSRMT